MFKTNANVEMCYLTDLCSLCLECDKNVTSQISINPNTLEILEYVIPESVLQKSEVPIQVCDNCLNKINNFFKFKQKCLENIIFLSEYVQKLIDEHGPHKYLSVKINQISHRQKDEIFTENHKNISNSEEPTFEIKVKTEITEDAVQNSTENLDKCDVANMEQLLIKVENSVENLYEKEEIDEELMIKDDSSLFESNMEDKSNTEYLNLGQNLPEIAVSSDVTKDKGMANEYENGAIQTLLPERSKDRYGRVYTKFVQWCNSKHIVDYTENSLILYFRSIPVTKSLWSTYSMLKSCLLIEKNIDISKFANLRAFLKRKSDTKEPKKAKKVLHDEQIRTFINESPDSTFLLMKVVLIMGVSGACRREELCKMSINDIEVKPGVVFVTIPATRTNVPRRFAVTDDSWIELIIKYNNLRPLSNKRYFLTYRDGKCINSPVGLNTFGKIPSQIAKYLKLDNPEEYTGHCFRRSSANLLANQRGLRRA